MKKRDFLRLILSGTTSTALPAITKSNFNLDIYEGEEPIIRTLGKTGIEVPIISSGKLPINNVNLARAIFKSGIKHFDSAYVYGEGRNDELLGEMLYEFGRDNYIISTKIWMPLNDERTAFTKEATTEAFMEQLETSLKRLKTEYVDILYLHASQTRETTLNEEILNGLRKAKEQGKARSLGLSAHSNQKEVSEAAIESKLYEILLIAYNFQYIDLKETIELINKNNLGLIAMKTLAGGYLDKEKSKPVNKNAAIKWILNDEKVHTALITIKTFDDLEKLLPLLYNIKMDENEYKDLEIAKNNQGLYCLGCKTCIPQCKNKLPIPDIMRAYMYTYGYGELRKGKNLLESLNITNIDCEDCFECLVKCSKKFDIKGKIKDISRLVQVPDEFLV